MCLISEVKIMFEIRQLCLLYSEYYKHMLLMNIAYAIYDKYYMYFIDSYCI